MGNFNGTLNSNAIFSALFNMIISQDVLSDNIAGTYSELVDMARVDGSLYGDTKLYYATDTLHSKDWGNDSEMSNLLTPYRPPKPECQKIELNVFRQISITVDNYLSKQAWSTEGAFSQFQSTILGWLQDTKRVYDSTTYNVFLGTDESSVGKQQITISIPTSSGEGVTDEATPVTTTFAMTEALNRLEGETIAKAIADLITDLKDVNRKYNDYGFLRSYRIEDLVFVWNADAANKINKIDLPAIYHKDIVEKLGEHALPQKYFGTINAATKTTASSGTRSLIEQDITFAGTETVVEPIQVSRTGYKDFVILPGSSLTAGDVGHLFAGDAIPTGTALVSGGSITVPSYQEDSTILFKVMHKRSIPYMSSMETGTSFFNAKALNESNFLTFGRNTLEHLKNYPIITVRKS